LQLRHAPYEKKRTSDAEMPIGATVNPPTWKSCCGGLCDPFTGRLPLLRASASRAPMGSRLRAVWWKETNMRPDAPSPMARRDFPTDALRSIGWASPLYHHHAAFDSPGRGCTLKARTADGQRRLHVPELAGVTGGLGARRQPPAGVKPRAQRPSHPDKTVRLAARLRMSSARLRPSSGGSGQY